MESVILSPYSRSLRNGHANPKNYPYWEDVCHALMSDGVAITQIGGLNEQRLRNVSQVVLGAPHEYLKTFINIHDTFMCVDNYLPHFINSFNRTKRGVVVFSQSDPSIFGYDQNINLLKGSEYLRKNQFGTWEEAEYNKDAFVGPTTVIEAVLKLLRGDK